MKIYVAGAYSGENVANIRAALDAAEKLVDLGHTPYVPHLTGFWDLVHPRPYEFWLAYDIEWLLMCDGLYRLPGPSRGADKEEAVARSHGIPVFYRLAALPPSTGQVLGVGHGRVEVNAESGREQAFDNAPQEGDPGAADMPSVRAIAEG